MNSIQKGLFQQPTEKIKDACQCGLPGRFFYVDRWYCEKCVIQLLENIREGTD